MVGALYNSQHLQQDIVFYTSYPLAAPADIPQNIAVNIISSVAISVTWEPPLPEDRNGIITSYTIQLYEIVTGQTSLIQREGHHTELLIDSLHPYYEYNVSIAAETVALGPFSESQTVWTLEDCEFYSTSWGNYCTNNSKDIGT